LPDGRLLVTSQEGTLYVVEGTTSTVALDLAARSKVCSDGEEGLLGVTVDPNFATNGFIYLYYTAQIGSCSLNGATPGGAKNRVSRFTMSGSMVNPSSEMILLDNMPEWGGNHNGGDVHVANDGTLYVSVGDGGGGRPDSAPADMSLPNGKILRINLDGTIPADNPNGTTVCKNSWGGGNKVCGEIWADGLRNPFRLGFDASAPGAKFRINDVGDATWEEVDDAVAGAHYGWPCREGPDPHTSSAPCNTPYTDPVLFYNHSIGCNVETGGAFVPGNTWQGYDDDYIWVDFGCGDLFIAQPGQNGVASAMLSTGLAQTTDLEFLQIGGVYELFYATFANNGELHMVIGPSSTPPPSTIPNTKFTAVQPTRLLDTRSGTGVAAGKLVSGGAITLKVTGGVVPDGAKAVALNVTATQPDGPGYVTAWPTGVSLPPTSSVNFSAANETSANAAVVAVGEGGQINFFDIGGTHLVVDVTGYFTDAASTTDGRFVAAAQPTRLLDTRTGTGGKATPFAGGDQFDLTVGGQQDVPAGATAAALTVTYVDDSDPGFITVWPTGRPRPLASTTNPMGGGDIRSNLALVPLGSGGKVSIFSLSHTDVVVDLVGWFTTASATQGLFTVVTPQRVADSRQPGAPFGRIPAGGQVTEDFSGGAPSPSSAVLYNLTATNTVRGGYITAHPAAAPVPLASSVNWSGPSQDRAALTISSLSSANRVSLFAFSAVDAIIDLSGWFQS
jgi:glucose/arabinose dehydrogenase